MEFLENLANEQCLEVLKEELEEDDNKNKEKNLQLKRQKHLFQKQIIIISILM